MTITLINLVKYFKYFNSIYKTVLYILQLIGLEKTNKEFKLKNFSGEYFF